jgi:hypothetical protein
MSYLLPVIVLVRTIRKQLHIRVQIHGAGSWGCRVTPVARRFRSIFCTDMPDGLF